MGILDKVRDFFYDEEDEFEEVKKKPSKHQNEKKEKIKIIEKEEVKKENKLEKQDISERELFKAERTFNFPFDVDDDEITPEVNEVKREEPKEEVKPIFKETKPLSIRNYTKYEKEEEKEEEVKKFKPTPVISPIYGILDKNYKKEDLLISDTKKPVKEEKKIDYESVRKRAYSNAYEKEEGDSKGIFFNLDEETKKEEAEEEVKIIYNDVDTEEPIVEDDKNKTIGEKIEEYEKSLEEQETDEEEDILSETKEQDLFNLIDNMYNSDEDDDEEE